MFEGWYVIDRYKNVIKKPLGWDVERFLVKGKRRHSKATFLGSLRLSTVFLALDHRYSGEGPPILWETMLFDDKNAIYDEDIMTRIFPEDLGQWRFSTKKEAMHHHNKKVKELKQHLQQEQMR